MLHIKLPKGKVAQACERAAEMASRRIAMANDRYRFDLERWRKDGGGDAPVPSKDVEPLIDDRNKLHAMADMAKHSTGDVYVSPELWGAIRGCYDV